MSASSLSCRRMQSWTESLLAAEVGDERWPKMAARWHARSASETSGIGAAESALALGRGARPRRGSRRPGARCLDRLGGIGETATHADADQDEQHNKQ